MMIFIFIFKNKKLFNFTKNKKYRMIWLMKEIKLYTKYLRVKLKKNISKV